MFLRLVRPDPRPARADWIHRALTGEPILDIGQLDAPTRRALDHLAETGQLVKGRVLFQGAREKTVWSRPCLVETRWAA